MRTNKQLLTDIEVLSELVGKQKEELKEIRYDKMTVTRLAAISTISCVSIILAIGYKFPIVKDEYLADLAFKDETISILKDESFQTNLQLNKLLSTLSMLSVTKETLRKDLKDNYPELSVKVKDRIINTIMEESERYNINPLILYALCHVESTFRPWLEHDSTIINVNGKAIRARAVGLTGIMWEHHKEELRNAGIAESRGDLFDPVTNIKAGAFVFNEYYKMDIIKGANSRDESALLRYFGGNFPVYVTRIDTKVLQVLRQSLYRRD